MFKAVFQCHWQRLQSSLCLRNVLLTWSWSLCAQEIWQFCTHRPCGLALHHLHNKSFKIRRHQICWGGAGYMQSALAVLWMHRLRCMMCFAGPSCLPRVLYSYALEASNAEQTLSQKVHVSRKLQSAWLHDTGTGEWMTEAVDLPKNHCKSICITETLWAVRYI